MPSPCPLQRLGRIRVEAAGWGHEVRIKDLDEGWHLSVVPVGTVEDAKALLAAWPSQEWSAL